MRERPPISEEHLRICLQEQYAIAVAALEFLFLRTDINAKMYRIVSEQGMAYLIKARPGPLYESSCLVPRYLRDQGITSVVAPLPTKNASLWTQVGEWTVIVYPFVEGECGWTPPMTDRQWKATGTALKQVHQATLPAEGFAALRREAFDPTEYSRWVRAFEAHEMQQVDAHSESKNEQALRWCWLAHQTTIHTAIATLETLAALLQQRSGPYVTCHADFHPGNLIRDDANRAFIIDWDDVMLAPKERDFLFVEVAADTADWQDVSPFFQGYGQVEIDWNALTYYCWERAIQDLIAYAQDVFFRDDVEEAIRTEAVQRFEGNFAKGGTVDAALAAAAHLPTA